MQRYPANAQLSLPTSIATSTPSLRPPTSIKPIPTTPLPLATSGGSGNNGLQSISILSQDDIVLQTQEEAKQRCKRLRQLAENTNTGECFISKEYVNRINYIFK